MTSADPSASESAVAPAPSAAAVALFGTQLDTAAGYVDLLASDGVAHGHIGPREVERLWSRHLVNSALLADLLPVGARFADVGSGAGLPGVPMAIRRPDLRAVLVEPMLRRCEFLGRVVHELELADRVEVVRGRADDAIVRQNVSGMEWVVARAVAPLDRLVRWCLPLVAPGGRILALKGETAAAEVDQHASAVRRAGGGDVTVHELAAPTDGPDGSADSTWVVSVTRLAPAPRGKSKGRR